MTTIIYHPRDINVRLARNKLQKKTTTEITLYIRLHTAAVARDTYIYIYIERV